MASLVIHGLVTLGLLLLLTRGTWCQPDAYLYFADYVRGTLYKMDLSLGQNARRIQLVAQNLPDPLQLDVDPYTENVYVANIYAGRYNTTKYINKYHFNSGNTATFPLPHSAAVWGLAVDPTLQLIYYTDLIHEMITVATTDLRYHTVIFEEALGSPEGIALDLLNKVMYWADSSKSSPHISKANMDGTNMETIVFHGLSSPGAMVYDQYDKKLYWTDWKLNTIERCDTDGGNRHILLTLTSSPLDLAVDEIYVYFSQRYKGPVYRVRKLGSRLIESIGERFADNATAYFTLAYAKKSPPPMVTNQCSGSSRGGCAHICIPTTQSWVCRCSVGYILQPDGTSCRKSPFQRGLVASDVNRRALIVLDLDTNVTKTITDTWYDQPTGVAIDEETSEVFWVDTKRKTISKACINTPCFEQVKEFFEEGIEQLPNHLEEWSRPLRFLWAYSGFEYYNGNFQVCTRVNIPYSEISALAIDSKKKQLYSVDRGLQRIVRNSYSGFQNEILVRGLTGFTSVLTLDVQNRMMYWANEEMIESSSMDGAGRSTFLRTGIQLSGLVFDSYGNRLFALHYQTPKVVEYSVNGATERLVYKPTTSSETTYYGIALNNGNLYFSDRDRQVMYEMNINTKEFKEYGRPRFKRVVGIAYFGLGDRTSQEPTKPPSTTTKSTHIAGEEDEGSTSPPGRKSLNQTLIIAVSVSAGGLLIIALIVICGIVAYKKIMASASARAPPTSSVAPHDPKPYRYDENSKDSVYEEPYIAKMSSLTAAPAAYPVIPLSTQPPSGGMNRLETRPRPPLPPPTENKPPPRLPLRLPSTKDTSYMEMRDGSGDLSSVGLPQM